MILDSNATIFSMIAERYSTDEYVGGWYDKERDRFVAIQRKGFVDTFEYSPKSGGYVTLVKTQTKFFRAHQV